MVKERCSVQGALGSCNYRTTLNCPFLSPSTEDWRRVVGEISVVCDQGTTQEIWGPQSYIKDSDGIVLSINFSLGFCSTHFRG